LITDLRPITQETKSGNLPSRPIAQVPLLVLQPQRSQQIDVWFLKKGLVISFFDSARARVAVCRQARKLAMSVAENTMLDDFMPQADSTFACHDVPNGEEIPSRRLLQSNLCHRLL
jgi:hypothetical protein